MSAAPLVNPGTQEWMARGLCTKMDASSASPADHKEMCGWCPVKDLCLATALADPSLHGIWGGTSEAERRLMRSGAPAREKGAASTPSERARNTRDRNRRIARLASQGHTLASIADRVGVSPRTVRRVLDATA